MSDIVFNGGDEIVEEFRIDDPDGDAVDLTGCTVTAEISWRGAVGVILTEAAGLEIADRLPSGDDAHGIFRVTEEQSVEIPRGRIAFVRYIVVNAAAITISTAPVYLDRRL